MLWDIDGIAFYGLIAGEPECLGVLDEKTRLGYLLRDCRSAKWNLIGSGGTATFLIEVVFIERTKFRRLADG